MPTMPWPADGTIAVFDRSFSDSLCKFLGFPGNRFLVTAKCPQQLKFFASAFEVVQGVLLAASQQILFGFLQSLYSVEILLLIGGIVRRPGG